MDAWMQLFETYKPAVAWLSFADNDTLSQWTESIRKYSPETRVWVQLGNVAAAVDVARACHPDALVLQGGDAGGHGHQNGASIVSLIPEVGDVYRDAIFEASDGGRATARSRIFDEVWSPSFWPETYEGGILGIRYMITIRMGLILTRFGL
jgi:nitronate monooxygenase